MSFIYPVSTYLFHSKAHHCALQASGIEDGMTVLEVATGSGEMFRRLINGESRRGDGWTGSFAQHGGAHAKSCTQEFSGFQRRIARLLTRGNMPFRDNSFDAVVCCYLLELLSSEDIAQTLREVQRVLRKGRNFTLVCIGQDADIFNQAYRVCGKVAPAFWGRQVEKRVCTMVESSGLRIFSDQFVRQGFYPSRVLVARK